MMNLELALYGFSLLVGGTMTGVEIAIGWLVHPTLYHLDQQTHARTAIALARIQGKVMPIWYAGTAILVLVLALGLFPENAQAHWLTIDSVTLWIGSIIYTLLGPARINNQIVQWDSDNLPSDWINKRQTWDFLHAIRTIVLLVAFGLLISATIVASATPSSK